MMKKILVLAPVINDQPNRSDVTDLERDDLKVTMQDISCGPVSVESDFDDVLAAPYIVDRVMSAERAGYHAVVLDCMADPGLNAARECVRIPVLGPRMVCAHVAATLGRRFSFICVKSRSRPRFESHVAEYGLINRLASIRAVDLDVKSVLDGDTAALHKRIVAESLAAVEVDGADVVIVGCTAFYGCEKTVGAALAAAGHRGIPVLNPIRTTITYAAALLDAGLTHSLRTYPAPPQKKRTGYNFLDAGNRV